MNDMRLPGLGLINNEPAPTQASADFSRDPAQAFDAVMSRFSNQRAAAPASHGDGNADAPAQSASKGAQGKTSGANGRSTQPNGQPVARTKPQDADEDEDCADPAMVDVTTDPTALVAVVNESAQLLAQNPAVAAQVSGAVAPAAVARETKTDSVASASVLDVLASHVNVATGRAGEKVASDPHAPIASDDEDVTPVATGAAPSRRAPIAAKDTLRIDAPLARALESAKTDVAQRFAVAANTVAQTPAHAAPVPAAENTAQAIAAAVGSSTTAATYSIAHAAVSAPIGTSGFANELSQRIVVFAGQKVQRAEIAVTPADLGPITVSIEVRGSEATLAFASSSHTTRAAIEDALPRLREMLSAQGLQLAGTHVGSEPRRDPYRPARNDKNSVAGLGAPEGIATISAPSNAEIRRRMNLIDIEV